MGNINPLNNKSYHRNSHNDNKENENGDDNDNESVLEEEDGSPSQKLLKLIINDKRIDNKLLHKNYGNMGKRQSGVSDISNNTFSESDISQTKTQSDNREYHHFAQTKNRKNNKDYKYITQLIEEDDENKNDDDDQEDEDEEDEETESEQTDDDQQNDQNINVSITYQHDQDHDDNDDQYYD